MQGIFLAAGNGLRLKPITNYIPKPLINIGGKTILEHILESFSKCALSESIIIINDDFLKTNTYSKLKDTEIKFKDNDYTQDKIRIIHSPIITLTKEKDYKDIRFNISTIGALDINPNKMKKFYLAYRKFCSLVHSKKFSIKFRLEKGDILSFNNRRVLHGRTSFNPNSGHRHLQGYYMDHDEILGRLNALKNIEV